MLTITPLPVSALSVNEPAVNHVFIVYNNMPLDPASEIGTGGGFGAWIQFKK